jgi:ribonuclease HI
MTNVTVYTDGACSGNPGPGGWGVLIVTDSSESIELNGGEKHTTNNRMELTAAIKALKHFKQSTKLTIFTDSVYVKEGISSWLNNWKARGWKTASKKPVKNEDLWKELDEQNQIHDVSWQWVKGHAGHPENERADYLARTGMP